MQFKHLFVVALSLPIVLAGCDLFRSKSDTVKIGIAGPITGQYATFGEQMEKGVKKAADDINKNGGLKGKQIEIIVGDDVCDPKQAVTVANKLVNDKVLAVVGHFCSSSSIPASEVYNTAMIPQMSVSSSPLYTERGLTAVFRTAGRDDQQGAVAANFIVDKLKAKRVVVLHDKDTYGQGIADATKKRLNELGRQEVLYEGVNRGDKDFNALVTKIKALKPDAVYFGGLHAEAALIVRQLRDQGVNVPFVSGDGIVSEDFLVAVGGEQYTKNVFMTFPRNPLKLESGKQVIEEFTKDGYNPEGYTLYAYAGLQAVAKALEMSDFDPKKAAEWLHNNSVDTVVGEIAWDEKGDVKSPNYVILAWAGKAYDELPDQK